MDITMAVRHKASGVVWKFPVTSLDVSEANAKVEALGKLPWYLDSADARPAEQQFNERYSFGGWCEQPGFTLIDGEALKYPGDSIMQPIGRCDFNGDVVLVYERAFVCVKRPDQTFTVARLD